MGEQQKIEQNAGRKILPVLTGNGEWDEINSRVGLHLKKMREREKWTQEQVSGVLIRVGGRTYQKMESGQTDTSFDAFIEVFHLLQGTDRDAAILFGNRESEIFIDESHDGSPSHIARLEKFAFQKYTVFFVDEMDHMKRMNLDFKNVINNSYVQGTAKIGRKYTYDCKLVSPVNSKYIFIYFTSTTSLVDRAFFILPEIEWVVGRFKRGIGIMISISTDTKRCPTLQLFALIHKCYISPDEEELKQFLALKRAQVSKYMLRVSDLKDRNVEFVNKLKLAKKA